MAFTRVFTASLELLEQWKTLNKEEIRNVLMSDELYQRDIKALEFLENRCSLLLHPYKTTLEVLLLEQDSVYILALVFSSKIIVIDEIIFFCF